MAEALRLADSATLDARPNPRVGCVLVNAVGAIVGRGQTQALGGAHAEVMALEDAGGAASGCTAYVTLEPCNHQGRTGPCSEALIAAGVHRVVCAAPDRSATARGGLARLRAAGVVTDSGLLESSARALNPGFHRRSEGGLPWVRLKMAATQDGRTALSDGRSQWITGEAARRDGHYWRARSDAVITGSGTVVADNPSLTVRHGRTVVHQPLRVVVDRRGQLEQSRYQIFNDAAQTLWLRGAQWNPHAVLAELAKQSCNEVLVEAGPTLSGAWLEAGVVDEVVLYLNPSILGGGRNLLDLMEPPELGQRWMLEIRDQRIFGTDCRIIARPFKHSC